MGEIMTEIKEKKNTTRKTIVKVIIFIVLFFVLLHAVMGVFRIDDYSIYSRENGFKQEKENTLDAVYIGASPVFSFFEPPVAWKDYGISVFTYAIPSLQPWAVKYRVIEARKTQKNSLYIISLNTFKRNLFSVQVMHRNLDYMPWSFNKVQLFLKLAKEGEFGASKLLEFLFPIIQFHSRWSSLTEEDYVHPVDGLKGAYIYNAFMRFYIDATDMAVVTDQRGEVPTKQKEALIDLMNYLETESVPTLFVVSPQIYDEETAAMMNTLCDMVRERGFDCLDLDGKWEDMEIQLDTDIHDENHTNIHGAIKFTKYLSEYLIKHYGFTDKRGQPEWESWDKSYERYMYYISPYTTDFEREHSPRDYNLGIPGSIKGIRDENCIKLSWDKVENAEGYVIYRKGTYLGEERDFVFVAEVPESQLSFSHYDLTPGESYFYAVIPVRYENGERIYGKFDDEEVRVRVPLEGE